MRRSRRLLAATALVLSVSVTTACGGGTDGGTGGDSDAPGLDAEATEAIEAAYAGSLGEPPESSPTPQPERTSGW